ncbi:MAG: 16S rRNA (cytosine(1402)-N(4))-methyltransferase RsmH [Evtepia sp.]
MQESYTHKPVLLSECIQSLHIIPHGVYLDGTLGRGGHSREIAKLLTENGHLFCLDRDQTALDEAKETLAPYLDRITFLHGNFADLDQILKDFPPFDGMLFDLGVSSPQIDDPDRGFSYRADAPLDMRMDQRDTLTAYDIVNHWSRDEIRRILYQYGEERYAGSIAAAIDRKRQICEIKTTLQLVDIIRSAMPSAALREKQHPAKRSFQGIRIAVNDELSAIRDMMCAAIPKLAVGGRLAVISFHSLEDRIVKTEFVAAATGCTCPPEFPVCICGKKPVMKLLKRKPILPSAEEQLENPRARSAKLRVGEKL